MVIYYNPKNTFLRLNEYLKKSNKFIIHFENDFYLFVSLKKMKLKKVEIQFIYWINQCFFQK